MAAQLGFWIGAFIILYLVSALVLLAFRDKKYTYQAVTISTLIALAIATLLGGYGLSEGGGPVFMAAFINYFVPAVAVLIVNLLRVSRKQTRSGTE